MMGWALAIAAGFGAGFVNVVAGGGSLLSLPALIYLGLPSTDANATNRVAILLQNCVAVWGYGRQGVGDRRLALWLALAACPSAFLGALAATRLDDALFGRVMGVAMLAVVPLIVLRPSAWIEGSGRSLLPRRRWVLFGVFFLLGFYGGFLQVGIGILILTALVQVGGCDLIQANGTKVLVILIYTAVALALFGGLGEVRWGIGLAMASGNMGGAWLGTRVAVRPGAKRWILGLLFLVVIATSLRLFGF